MVFKSSTIEDLRKVTHEHRHLAKLEKVEAKFLEQPGLPDF